MNVGKASFKVLAAGVLGDPFGFVWTEIAQVNQNESINHESGEEEESNGNVVFPLHELLFPLVGGSHLMTYAALHLVVVVLGTVVAWGQRRARTDLWMHNLSADVSCVDEEATGYHCSREDEQSIRAA